MQPNKSIKIFIKYFVGPVLFIWLAFSIYQQIVHQPQLEDTWQGIRQSMQSYKIVYLLLSIILIFFNWGLESWKWQLLVKDIKQISFFRAFKAVLSGVSFSVVMPNRVGEYIGRMMYMPDGSRLKTISAAVVGSMAQLIITISAGILGLVVLNATLLDHYPEFLIWYQFIVYGLFIILLLLLLIYFNVSIAVKLFKRWPAVARYLYLVESLSNFNARFLLRLIFISFLRYLVFLLQYILVFVLFDVDVSIAAMCWVMSVVFLALAVIPSIALIELGLRGQISLKLMAIFTTNSLGVGLTTVTIWILNLILPAILGSLFLLGIKMIKDGRRL